MDLTSRFLLLTIHPDKGSTRTMMTQQKYGLAGALLLEWTLAGKIVSEEKGRMRFTGTPSGTDGIRDQIAVWAAGRKKPQKPRNWVNSLAQKWSDKLRKTLLDELVAQGILRHERKKFLWLIPYSVYPVMNR
ncbi:hypothetical protein GF324_06650, partial [bacterium]|nr:hypothetical protein [bacterium]